MWIAFKDKLNPPKKAEVLLFSEDKSLWKEDYTHKVWAEDSYGFSLKRNERFKYVMKISYPVSARSQETE